ncbi:hypothetical protein HMPREF9711_03103 [Myroides odoratimimus CCUG 3837]|uniref:hypothetical protein n=1 Tax=Myroides odoratimimus TaxID=76832 RepID=UPI000280AC39|nr:hypothetical protein [Myroides odoratimimus]EKB02641.1 hypothetical protein HMPREF9711_03103 [Myroides odoratimimus CCUG 3837]
MKKLILLFLLLSALPIFAQAGLSISPGKMYFRNAAGTIATQKVRIANPNDKAVEVGVSIGDWNYDEKGSNNVVEANILETSASQWIQVLPNSYFLIEPNEVKEVEIILNVPQDLPANIPVHTAMVFFTQLNPGNAVDENGAAIKVTVRMGLKVYHANQNNTESVEIVDIKPAKTAEGEKAIEVNFQNDGKLWSDGKMTASIFNQQTGEKTTLNTLDFYSLPTDLRKHIIPLPNQLKTGTYTFIIQLTYGKDNIVKVAELDFTL